MKVSTSQLAIHGGEKAVTEEHPELFKWPIVTEEDEPALASPKAHPVLQQTRNRRTVDQRRQKCDLLDAAFVPLLPGQ